MRSFLISAASIGGFLLLLCALASGPAAQGACTTTYDCHGNSGCSGVMGGNVTQRNITEYTDQASCVAAAQKIMASEPLPTIACSCGGSGTTTDTSSNIGQLISTMTPQQQMGVAAGAVGTLMIMKGLSELMSGPQVDPAQQQRNLAAKQLNNSGVYLMKQKDYPGAINEFQQALAQTPNDSSIKNNLAAAKQAQKNGVIAGQTSGALGQLLGTSPAGGGPEIASNGSPLSMVNLNNPGANNPGTSELRPPGEAAPANESSLQGQIDGVFGNAPAAAPANPAQAQGIDQIFDATAGSPVPPPPAQTQIDAEKNQVDDLFKGGGSTPASAQLVQQASSGEAAANAASPEEASAGARAGFDTGAPSAVVPGAATPSASAPQAVAEPGSSEVVDLSHSEQAPVVADLKTPASPATAPEYPVSAMRAPVSDATFSAPGSPIFDCAGDRTLIKRLQSGLKSQDDAIQRTEDAAKAAREDSDKAREKAMSAAVSTLLSSATTAASWAQAGMAKAGALRSAGITAEEAERFKSLKETKEMLEYLEHVKKAAEKVTELTSEDKAELNARPEEHSFSNASEVENATRILEDALKTADDAYKAGKFDEVLEEGAAKGATILGGPVAGAAMHTLVNALNFYVSAQQSWNSAGEAAQAEHNVEVMRDERRQVQGRITELQQEVVSECANTKTAGY